MNLLISDRTLGVHISASEAFYTMELVTIGNNHVNNTMPQTWKVPGALPCYSVVGYVSAVPQAKSIQNEVGSEENGEDG